MWTRAISSSSAWAGAKISSLQILSIDGLQTLPGFLDGIDRLAGQPRLLRRLYLCPQLQNFFPALIGVNAHNDQIALAILCNVDGRILRVGQVGDGAVIIPQSVDG